MATVTVVLLPAATEGGLALQFVSAAGIVQLMETDPVKPFAPATETEYVAALPATTVALVVRGVSVKSGPRIVSVAKVGVFRGR